MKKPLIIFLILGLMLGALCYLATNNIIYGAGIAMFFILDYLILMNRRFKRYYSLIERVHTSYHFINSFIITMSVKNSVEEAYQNGLRIQSKRLKIETDQLTEMAPLERVKYLRGYFDLSIYMMFLNVVDLHQDQGGNILSMSDNLMKECTRTERTLSDTLAIGFKHLREFVVLWVMSIGILIFLRFSLKDFYITMLQDQIFTLLILMFFLICIISINLFVIAYTDLTVKEASK